jgi:hypothetical protein
LFILLKDLQCLLELLNSIVYVVEVELADCVLSAFLRLSDCFIVICISFYGSATSGSGGLLNWLADGGLELLGIGVLDGRRLVERILHRLAGVLVDGRGHVLCRGHDLRLVVGDRLASWCAAKGIEVIERGLLLLFMIH